jgi:hypothetical protein
VIDALGLPLTFEITEGQRHDSQPAEKLVQRAPSACLLADKAYDSTSFERHSTLRAVCPSFPATAVALKSCPTIGTSNQARSEIECFVQFAEAGSTLRYALRKDPSQLRGGGRHWLRSAVAANLGQRHSSRLTANLMSIDTTGTNVSLPAL